MTILSNADLAQRAGIDPWALDAKIAVGDPAQVDSLAAAFYKAGGNMAQANTETGRSEAYRKDGYTTGGTSPIDFDAEAKATAASPENLQAIGKVLDSIGTDLSTAMKTSNTEITALEKTLSSIETQWTTFMQQIGHHLPPDDQEAERTDLINNAVAAVKAHGTIIDAAIKKYEEAVFGAQKSMSDLGYVPPAKLDDLYGDGAQYIKQLQAQARADADKLRNNHNIDGNWAKDAHDVAGLVAPYMNDPYFASAFYGELGPQITQSLPMMLQQSDSSTAGADIKTFSHMFGTAVTNQQDDPKMQAVSDVFLHDPGNAPTAWDRGVMVSNGDFPPDWLAKAARANSLDDFAKNGDKGFNGRGFDGAPAGPFAGDIGMSTDDVAVWTHALGRNPVAAREALATMGNGDPSNVTMPSDPTAAYQTNIHKLIEYGRDSASGVAHDNHGVQVGSGELFAAASGADNETDGAHSPQAITFAKALFNDVGHDSGDVGNGAAPSMAKIGASYIQEMAAGNDQDGNSIVGVDANGRIPGDNAAFGIPPDLAKSFMKTFVADPAATQTFDHAAGLAAHHAMLAGAQQDVALLKQGKSADAFGSAAEAYGSVAGSENGAAIQVVGKQVEDEEHANEVMKGVLSAGIDLFPAGGLAEDGGKLLAKIPDVFWDASKHGANMGLESIYGAEPGSTDQLNQLKDANYETAMTSDYQRTSILREAGYPGTDDIPKDLLTPNGQMVNVATVMGNDHLKEEYYDYMHNGANAPQGNLGHGASVYTVTKNATGRYVAAYGQAKGDDEGK